MDAFKYYVVQAERGMRYDYDCLVSGPRPKTKRALKQKTSRASRKRLKALDRNEQAREA